MVTQVEDDIAYDNTGVWEHLHAVTFTNAWRLWSFGKIPWEFYRFEDGHDRRLPRNSGFVHC
jgi:hypothetical protein